jgi:hypothetical protein
MSRHFFEGRKLPPVLKKRSQEDPRLPEAPFSLGQDAQPGINFLLLTNERPMRQLFSLTVALLLGAGVRLAAGFEATEKTAQSKAFLRGDET